MNNPVLPTKGTAHGTPITELLTKAQAASYLGIAPRTLDDWRSAQAIPCIEWAGYVRFYRSDLDAFLEAHRVAAAPRPSYRDLPVPLTGNPIGAEGEHSGSIGTRVSSRSSYRGTQPTTQSGLIPLGLVGSISVPPPAAIPTTYWPRWCRIVSIARKR